MRALSLPLSLTLSACGPQRYADVDRDGFGDVHRPVSGDEDGAASIAGDCNDHDPAVNPAAYEVCDGVDDDCDGVVDPAEIDDDGDGHVECAPVEWKGPLQVRGGLDCDDLRPQMHPGAIERCNGEDDDCDGALLEAEVDADRDGALACAPVDPSVPGPDCDDASPARAPHLPESCDGLDNDCDGALAVQEHDRDGDGFVGCEGTGPWLGDPALAGGDCDDLEPSVRPGAAEACDGLDGDCDGLLLETEEDRDGDGFVACAPWLGDPAIASGDCDGADGSIHPGAPERCDGRDQDCDGAPGQDERDDDGDGWIACDPDPGGWYGPPVLGFGDCDDGTGAASPGGQEICDRLDNDCNGLIDDQDPAVDPATFRTFYRDRDGDDYGVASLTARACALPPGFAAGEGDCDDAERAIHPRRVETCDGVDDNCDGLVDDQDPDLEILTAVGWFPDRDGDGYGDAAAHPRPSCAPPEVGWTAEGGDCLDRDPDRNPGAVETCDGVDQDCDGHVDLPARGGARRALGCDLCPSLEGEGQERIALETRNPCLLDPLAVGLCRPGLDTHSEGERLHRIAWRADLSAHRDELFVFLPPSDGNGTITFLEWAARAGYLALQPGLENSEDVEGICAEASDPALCQQGALAEQMYGEDGSPDLEIGPHDGAEHRLEVLLEALEAEHPGMGWGSYLLTDGSVDWSRIVVSGWSRGATLAAYIADDHATAGALFVSGGQRYVPMNPSMATPGCRMFGLYHELEWQEHYASAEAFEANWRAFGVTGPTISVDTERWPWPADARVFTTGTTDIQYERCTAHKSTCNDPCMDRDALFEPYAHLFCWLIEGPALTSCAP